jgi:hypothetical protein
MILHRLTSELVNLNTADLPASAVSRHRLGGVLLSPQYQQKRWKLGKDDLRSAFVQSWTRRSGT